MTVKIKRSISWQKYDDTVYIMDESTETIHKLEKAGAVLWDIILQKSDVDEIIEDLFRIYDVTKDELTSQINAFLDELNRLNIVEVSEYVR